MRYHAFLNFARGLGRDERGVFALLLALTMVPLLAVVGLAVDSGLFFETQSRLTFAMDAGGLAAGVATPGCSDCSLTQIQKYQTDIAQAYFNANFGSSTSQTLAGTPAPTITLSASAGTIVASVSNVWPTSIFRLLGFSAGMPGFSNGVANSSLGMGSAASYSYPTNVDIALVLDNTGSMSQALGSSEKITQLIAAARNFVVTFQNMAKQFPNNKYQISMVPFTVDVNTGASGNVPWVDFNLDKYSYILLDQLKPSPNCHLDTGWGGSPGNPPSSPPASATIPGVPIPLVPGAWYIHSSNNTTGPCGWTSAYQFPAAGWEGGLKWGQNGNFGTSTNPRFFPVSCVTDRAIPYNSSNSAPTGLVDDYVPDNSNCTTVPLVPLEDVSTVTSCDSGTVTGLCGEINDMVANGDTNLTIGFVWGWNMLTPGAPQSTATLDPNLRKYIIIMTDGQNTQDRFNIDNFNQTGPNGGTQAFANMNAFTEATCDAIKNEVGKDGSKINIFTIGTDDTSNPSDSADLPLLSYCASTPASTYNFVITDAGQLQNDFQTIAASIANLRVSS